MKKEVDKCGEPMKATVRAMPDAERVEVMHRFIA
jgi:hypothetical protein